MIFSAGRHNKIKPHDIALSQPFLQRLPGVWWLKMPKPCRWTCKQLHHGVLFFIVSSHDPHGQSICTFTWTIDVFMVAIK